MYAHKGDIGADTRNEVGAMLPIWKSPIVWAAVVCAVLFYGGILRPRNSQTLHSLAHINEIRILRGEVAGNPVKTSSGASYLVRLRPSEAVDLYGRRYSCKGEVAAFINKETMEAYHPASLFTASRKGGAILCESGAVLELQGRFGNGDAFGVKTAKMLGWGRAPFSYIKHFRALCRLRFRALMAFWGSAGGLLLALISGIREYTESDAREAFRYAGLSHILALSGMHLSLVSGLALATSKKTAGKRAAYFVQAAAVASFVWFAGFTPSLLRAFIMASILLFMALFDVNEKNLIAVLCATFLLHTIISHGDIKTAAFMLSYGALIGILTVGEGSKRLFSCVLPPVLSAPFCASIGAQVLAAPISLYLFGEFMPIGIVASVLVSPLVVVFIYMGIALIVLSLAVPPLAIPSGIVLGAVYKAIKILVLFFSRAPGIHLL